jgi:apolipoprotein N-acyltransferase
MAARPARAIGFNLLTLALGWTLVEVVLHLHNPSGRHDGLLTGSQAEGPQLHWFARLLGYVCTAFLVACANASLLGILSGARLSFPACRSLTGSPNAGAWAPSQVVLVIQSWTRRQAHPRAPPT